MIATATSYGDLVDAIIARRAELGLTQLNVDEIAGLQTGYTGKLECGAKGLGQMSLDCLLGVIGLELAVTRVTPHHERQKRVVIAGSCGQSDAANRVASAPQAQRAAA